MSVAESYFPDQPRMTKLNIFGDPW